MYSSLAAAKAAVISVGEEIATTGLPSRIFPLVFVFTGAGNGVIKCRNALSQYFVFHINTPLNLSVTNILCIPFIVYLSVLPL